eukprot:2550677-Pleurochrysis_carterae.AAC.1
MRAEVGSRAPGHLRRRVPVFDRGALQQPDATSVAEHGNVGVGRFVDEQVGMRRDRSHHRGVAAIAENRHFPALAHAPYRSLGGDHMAIGQGEALARRKGLDLLHQVPRVLDVPLLADGQAVALE